MQLEEFFGDNIPPYTILSHTWGKDEVTFGDFTSNQTEARTKEGYKKIDLVCIQTLQEPLHQRNSIVAYLNYAWVDTCCIDKTSSAELSEAINSMFMWYAKAEVCFAYLLDVSASDPESHSAQSKWFSRGWTLQELIAPSSLRFYDRDWIEMGTRSTSIDWVTEATGIPQDVLDDNKRAPAKKQSSWEKLRWILKPYPAAVKISWASRRNTTRVEDMSYCLLGLLDVNMPLLYGEGSKAFIRLQKELVNQTHDDSILAWGLDGTRLEPLEDISDDLETHTEDYVAAQAPLLASSPHNFRLAGNLSKGSQSYYKYSLTNLGLEMEIPLIKVWEIKTIARISRHQIFWIGILSCFSNDGLGFVGIPLLEAVVGEKSDRLILTRTLIGDHEKLDETNINSTNTLILGPKAMVRAKMKDVIITASETFRRWHEIEQPQGPPRIVNVDDSGLLRNTGYSVVFGALASSQQTSTGVATKSDEIIWSGTWNKSSKFLILDTHPPPSSSRFIEPILFHFQHRWHERISIGCFTVLINLTTKERGIFSGKIMPNTWWDIKQRLKTLSTHHAELTKDATLRNRNIRFKKRTLHGRDIFELAVE